MEFEFLDREFERRDLFKLIRIRPSRPRVITVDSPAGMGKTRLIFEVCRGLVKDAYGDQIEWRIVRLDFREHFPKQYSNERGVIEEIARQFCRDTRWDNVYTLIQEADPDDQILIREAALIPMEDAVRQALLHMVADISLNVLDQINHIVADAFENVDILEAVNSGDLLSVPRLVDFLLGRRFQPDPCPIPDHVLFVLDGVDAIPDDRLRKWVVNDLARELGVHSGLQQAFGRCAVVVSGRFIEQDLDPQKKEQDFLTIPLRSFTNRPTYVEDLIRQFGDERFSAQDDLVNRLARELCQVCGGHPGVIKETAAELYANPGHFATLEMDPASRTGYWHNRDKFKSPLRESRETAIAEILEGVGERERCLLRLLSIFRKFNSATLDFLHRRIKEKKLHRFLDCFQGNIKELYGNLRETRLIGNDAAEDPFDSDRFSLSLLSAAMRDKDREMFDQLNEWAADMFADWVKGKFSDDPDAPLETSQQFQRMAVCEWLFHRLHLAKPCSSLEDAGMLGQRISGELGEILEDIRPFPTDESQADQRQRIKGYIERDEQIDHLIWKKALEVEVQHDTIRAKILRAF